MNKICVIGTGYVGLVSGVCFAEIGNKVTCADIDVDKIEKLKNGIMPIYENGLKEMCSRNYKNNSIEFTTDIKYAVQNNDIIFIAVGTPPLPDGNADLSAVKTVSAEIAQYINGYKIVVNKSTVPVGTQKMVKKIISGIQSKYDFDVISNPEFLREGTAVYDTMNMNRAVIGSESETATEIMLELHKPFKCECLITTPESAEIIKYAANSFLATKITFINEIANLCELVGADVKDVSKGIGMDPRISPDFLKAGIGYGGGCFPKDTMALLKMAENYRYDFKILRNVIEVNKLQRLRIIDKLKETLVSIDNKLITVLGLAFKAGTDDMRESPAIEIIDFIQKSNGKVRAFDPCAMERAKNIFNSIEYTDDAYSAVKDADAVVIITDWDEFKHLDLKHMKELMHGNTVIDGRNIFPFDEMIKLDFDYHCIGRSK